MSQRPLAAVFVTVILGAFGMATWWLLAPDGPAVPGVRRTTASAPAEPPAQDRLLPAQIDPILEPESRPPARPRRTPAPPSANPVLADAPPPNPTGDDTYPPLEEPSQSGGVWITADQAPRDSLVSVWATARIPSWIGAPPREPRRGSDARIVFGQNRNEPVFIPWFGVPEATVLVRAPNGALGLAESVRLAKPGQEAPKQAVRLSPRGEITVRGSVRWSDGSPAAGLGVVIEYDGLTRGPPTDPAGIEDFWRLVRWTSTVDERGQFAIPHVWVTGRFRLRVMQGDADLAVLGPLRLVGSDVVLPNIILGTFNTLDVSLTLRDQPVPFVTVTATPGNGPEVQQQTDVTGHARFKVQADAGVIQLRCGPVAGVESIEYGRQMRQGRKRVIMDHLESTWQAVVAGARGLTTVTQQDATLEIPLDPSWERVLELTPSLRDTRTLLEECAQSPTVNPTDYPPGLIVALRAGDLDRAERVFVAAWKMAMTEINR